MHSDLLKRNTISKTIRPFVKPRDPASQEDSISMYNGSSFAALFLSSDRTYVIQPAAGGPEAKANVENQLFQRLDTMFPREHVRVRPGKILVAVYNDNWSALHP